MKEQSSICTETPGKSSLSNRVLVKLSHHIIVTFL